MAIPNFSQMKDLYSLQKKAKQMQKELKDLEIEAKSADGLITAVASGEMKLVSIEIDNVLLDPSKKSELEKGLIATVGQVMSRAQSESATRMQPLLKDLNLPGM